MIIETDKALRQVIVILLTFSINVLILWLTIPIHYYSHIYCNPIALNVTLIIKFLYKKVRISVEF